MQQLSAGVFLVLLAAAPAGAQAVSTSQITGIVRDESGAALPGVTITATQTETGLTRVVVSDDVGGYVMTSNASVVYQIPAAGETALARAVTGGWQLSAIVSARSGSYFTVTTGMGVDDALSGQPNQRAHQVLRDPFMPHQTFAQWLNPDAFEAPAPGTYGTMPIDAIQGPGRFTVDMGLARSFGSGRRQVQLRLEAFNLLNTVNPDNPVATMNSPDFGQINRLAAGTAPRIMQLAVKYLF